MFAALGGGRFGLGTVFYANHDPQNVNNHLACVPIKDTRYRVGDRRRYTHKVLDDARDYVVALPRRYPCGLWVWIFCPRTGRATLAQVADRGPAHALVDMSKPVARALGHNGKENVFLLPLPGR